MLNIRSIDPLTVEDYHDFAAESCISFIILLSTIHHAIAVSLYVNSCQTDILTYTDKNEKDQSLLSAQSCQI